MKLEYIPIRWASRIDHWSKAHSSTLNIGWGGLFAVMLIRRLGRLPILFWSQVSVSLLFCEGELKGILLWGSSVGIPHRMHIRPKPEHIRWLVPHHGRHTPATPFSNFCSHSYEMLNCIFWVIDCFPPSLFVYLIFGIRTAPQVTVSTDSLWINS